MVATIAGERVKRGAAARWRAVVGWWGREGTGRTFCAGGIRAGFNSHAHDSGGVGGLKLFPEHDVRCALRQAYADCMLPYEQSFFRRYEGQYGG